MAAIATYAACSRFFFSPAFQSLAQSSIFFLVRILVFLVTLYSLKSFFQLNILIRWLFTHLESSFFAAFLSWSIIDITFIKFLITYLCCHEYLCKSTIYISDFISTTPVEKFSKTFNVLVDAYISLQAGSESDFLGDGKLVPLSFPWLEYSW